MARYHVLDDPLNPLPYAGAHLFPGLLPLLPLVCPSPPLATCP